jgi:drug/metabolite transporter (DMT)-like permease
MLGARLVRRPRAVRAAHVVGRLRASLAPSVRGTLWAVTAVLIWGVYLAVARANVSDGARPADLAVVRFATAGLVMLPWLLRHGPTTMAGMGWRTAGVLTLLGGPLFILAGAGGFRFAPLAHGATVQPAAITIAALALGALVLGDRLTRAQVAGAGVMVAGLALVAGPQAAGGGLRALAGDALFALAGTMWAAFAVLSRRWRVSPIAATAVVSVLSATAYTPFYLATRGIDALLAQPPATLVQQVVVQGVLSGVVAVFAFGRAVELLGASRAAAFPALVPVVATLTGIPLTGETPGMRQVLGLLIVTAGLFVIQRRSPAAPLTRSGTLR